jgi:hypothetical protein
MAILVPTKIARFSDVVYAPRSPLHHLRPRRLSLQSSSASRYAAGAAGFLISSQSLTRPDRWLGPSRFDAMPSQPSEHACLKIMAPSPSKNGIDGQCCLMALSRSRARLNGWSLFGGLPSDPRTDQNHRRKFCVATGQAPAASFSPITGSLWSQKARVHWGFVVGAVGIQPTTSPV